MLWDLEPEPKLYLIQIYYIEFGACYTVQCTYSRMKKNPLRHISYETIAICSAVLKGQSREIFDSQFFLSNFGSATLIKRTHVCKYSNKQMISILVKVEGDDSFCPYRLIVASSIFNLLRSFVVIYKATDSFKWHHGPGNSMGRVTMNVLEQNEPGNRKVLVTERFW